MMKKSFVELCDTVTKALSWPTLTAKPIYLETDALKFVIAGIILQQ